MSQRSANVAAGSAGILYVILWVIGLFVIIGFIPTLGATEQEVAAFFERSPTRIWTGGLLILLGFLLLLVFIARLIGILRRAEGEVGWVWVLALSGATAWVIIEMATAAGEGAAFLAGSRGLDLDVAKALMAIGNFGFFISTAFSAIFLGATAYLIVRTAALPGWLGWLAALVAVVSLISVPLATQPMAQVAVPLRSLWILLASIVVMTTTLNRGQDWTGSA